MRKSCLLLLVILIWNGSYSFGQTIYVVGSPDTDLLIWLSGEGIELEYYADTDVAMKEIPHAATLLLLADGYPSRRTQLPTHFFQAMKDKEIRYYLEYPQDIAGVRSQGPVMQARLERGVVAGNHFGESLPAMRILGINDCHLIPMEASDPMLVLAKVAGLDTAPYGLEGVPVYPMLVAQDRGFVAMTKLSDFAKGRYGPEEHWKKYGRT